MGALMGDPKDKTPPWSSGVRIGKYDGTLPTAAALEVNFLGVPLGVLNSKIASKTRSINYSWRGPLGQDCRYSITRTSDRPFPIASHVLTFDVLIAMFTHNFQTDGQFYFLWSDVLRQAGKDPNNRGAREAGKEAIRRIQACSTTWVESFDGRTNTWSEHPISWSSIVEDEAKGFQRNPRRAKTVDEWHGVKFCSQIVAAIQDKKIRLILSEVLQSGLPPETYAVYRYFRRFTDRNEIVRSLAQIKTAMHYQGEMRRFKPWLKKHLEALKQRGYAQMGDVYEDYAKVRLTDLDSLMAERKKPLSIVEVPQTNVVISAAIDLAFGRNIHP